MWHAPNFWRTRTVWAWLLLPLSGMYYALHWLRCACTRTQRAGVPVICIGNAVAGGAGKTPAVLYVAEALTALGKRVVCLSRGYGGALASPVQVHSAHHTAHDVGDEALLLAQHFPTVVARDRASGARMAASLGADVVVMDDGFQNPGLHKTFSLLVVDARYRFGNGFLLPAGPLREPVTRALKHAHAVLVMGKPWLNVPLPVYEGRLTPTMPTPPRAVAFAGIGQPEKLRDTLAEHGTEVAAFVPYPDHHPYTEHDLHTLLERANAVGAPLVTTEKDWVRLPSAWQSRIMRVPVKLEIQGGSRLIAQVMEHIA